MIWLCSCVMFWISWITDQVLCYTWKLQNRILKRNSFLHLERELQMFVRYCVRVTWLEMHSCLSACELRYISLVIYF